VPAPAVRGPAAAAEGDVSRAASDGFLAGLSSSPNAGGVAMTESAGRSAASLLEEVADASAATLAARSQTLRLDPDARLWLSVDEAAIDRLRDLVRIAAQTAPAQGELLLSATRGGARVQAVGEGELVLRWQLAGVSVRAEATEGGSVVPLRPPARTAEEFFASAAARALAAAFEAVGSDLSFESIGEGDELLARVRVPSA